MEDLIVGGAVQRASIKKTSTGISLDTWFGCYSQPRSQPPEGTPRLTCRRVYRGEGFEDIKSCGKKHRTRKAAWQCCARLSEGWLSRAPGDCTSWVEIIPAEET